AAVARENVADARHDVRDGVVDVVGQTLQSVVLERRADGLHQSTRRVATLRVAVGEVNRARVAAGLSTDESQQRRGPRRADSGESLRRLDPRDQLRRNRLAKQLTAAE